MSVYPLGRICRTGCTPRRILFDPLAVTVTIEPPPPPPPPDEDTHTHTTIVTHPGTAPDTTETFIDLNEDNIDDITGDPVPTVDPHDPHP